MTKIKSHFGKTLTIREWKMSPGKVAFECEANDDGTGEHARLYDRTELHAALGVDELGCGCDEADQNLKKALARAEDAEAVGATAVKRAEEAEAEHEATKKAYRDLGANHAKLMERLAEAEATIERVKAAVAGLSCGCARAAVSDALGLTKPFVLPTAVPARIVAVKSSTGDEKELTLFTDGDTTWWADIEDWGPFWTRSQVMEQFTDHRLMEPES